MRTYILIDIDGGPRTVHIRQYNDHAVSVRGLMRGLWHERSRSFDTAEEASTYLKRRIRGLVARGYGIGERNLELEARIAVEPDDPGAYAVYADWLEEREDARAALIRAHLMELDADPILAEHQLQLVPSWLTPVRWRWGFIHTARANRYYRVEDEDIGQVAAQIAQRTLRHPSGLFLERVEVVSDPEWGQGPRLFGSWERGR